MRRADALLVMLALLGCHSPTAPTENIAKVYGRLSGVVKIGPNCPVEQAGNPCPTPPGAYALRKILVFDEKRTNLLFTVDIDSQGLYLIDLVAGKYLVDAKLVGIDRTSDLPKLVEIHTNSVTKLDVNIDTGLR
ncbi:MAG TPA: hypothetical protein VER58_01615 [Thermoanaerobaculia bacterium]|nr:hypothetical protein [Thermoanaerobaculia bacterium]